ncbi:hypothetical protein ITP53_54695 [Nonomuraea sp. K274]|uniref:Uncharacterized protein n=1 Tax=Nonomuraea cypriaca TaxID=1187855 RepID=A0A931AP70_9ACTN|nr:hypothetical protein [Nonomuraea cypriaca]MBF8194559.1 hypothetical protein [Nonomuraea cypriaca]
MGLTSSGGVTVNCKLQARASSRPILSQPRDHDSKRASGYLAGEALAAEMGFLTRTLSAVGYIVHPEEEPDG